jgi:hypothetical protein
MADAACVVYRISQSKYRALFEQVWGPQSFDIAWPANIDQVVTTPGPAPASDPFPVHLGLPKNLGLAFLYEDQPDQFGFTANPAGPNGPIWA